MNTCRQNRVINNKIMDGHYTNKCQANFKSYKQSLVIEPVEQEKFTVKDTQGGGE